MNDLATAAREASLKAFDELYRTQVSLASQSYSMTAEERAYLRKIITSHEAWNAYRAEWAIDASALDKRRVLHFCETRGIDWRVALVRFHEERQNMDEAARTETNDRAAQAEAAAKANAAAAKANGFSDNGNPPGMSDADKAAKIAEASRASMDKIAKEEAARQEARTAADRGGFTDMPAKVEKPASEPQAPTVPTFGGDAIVQAIAGAVWTPMLAAIKADMDATLAKAIGELPTTTITVKRADDSTHKLDPIHHPKLPTLIRVCTARQKHNNFPPNVWISGPTGSGKSHAAQQVATALGLDFHVQGAMSQSFELLGFIDAGGHYHATPFRRAFEHGGVVLLDEIDAGSNEAMLAVNGATANGGCSFPDGYIKRHPDCIILGAANTWGTGPSAEYVGRAKIDTAILSRFPVKLPWDYDTALEVRLASNEAFTRRVQDARRRARASNVKHLIDPRQSQAGGALIDAGFTSDEAAELTYLAGLKPEEIRIVEGR